MIIKLKLQLYLVCLLALSFTSASAQDNLKIVWSSLNGGGVIFLPDSSQQLSYSVGQPIIGVSQMDSLEMQMGFWSRFACTAIPGDAISFGQISLADVISIVNYIFNKPCPYPIEIGFECWLGKLSCRGDVNGNQKITLSDVIWLVNYIFNKPCPPERPGPKCWIGVPSDICCLRGPY